MTQIQCEVCAVSENDLRQAVCDWTGMPPRIVSLNPNQLSDVWSDIRKVSKALESPERAEDLIRSLASRMEAIHQSSAPSGTTSLPRVACIEWIEPLMTAGNTSFYYINYRYKPGGTTARPDTFQTGKLNGSGNDVHQQSGVNPNSARAEVEKLPRETVLRGCRNRGEVQPRTVGIRLKATREDISVATNFKHGIRVDWFILKIRVSTGSAKIIVNSSFHQK